MNADVRIEAQDCSGLERRLRHCARPPFALERLRQWGAELVYHCPEPQTGGKRADLVLRPLELIERIAAPVPPPRMHQQRYYGVFASNSSLRAARQPKPELVIEEEFPQAGIGGRLFTLHHGRTNFSRPDVAGGGPLPTPAAVSD